MPSFPSVPFALHQSLSCCFDSAFVLCVLCPSFSLFSCPAVTLFFLSFSVPLFLIVLICVSTARTFDLADGERFVLSGSTDCCVRIWALSSGEFLSLSHAHAYKQMCGLSNQFQMRVVQLQNYECPLNYNVDMLNTNWVIRRNANTKLFHISDLTLR